MTNIRFRDWLDEQMKDPCFRFWYYAWWPWYQVARFRVKFRRRK